MLLAPFSLTDSSTPQRRSAARMPMQVPAWLLAWVALGTLALVLIPATRGGDVGGYSLPFWLLGAPLLAVLWLTRRRWLPRIGHSQFVARGSRSRNRPPLPSRIR